jgi:hypothetical protein
MEEWSDWVVEDSDPAEMVRQMRTVLADPRRSQDDKLEALSLLTNMADEDAVAVLRWYRDHADPAMRIPAMLAVMEADQLNRPPHFADWHDELIEVVQDVGQILNPSGAAFPTREVMRTQVAQALRDGGWRVVEGGQALLKYDGQLINLTPVDLVVNEQLLVGFWDRADEENAWADIDDEEDADMFDPLEQFYATLRSANLPWGLLVDISGDMMYTDLLQNLDVDRGRPKVEYLLSLPKQ